MLEELSVGYLNSLPCIGSPCPPASLLHSHANLPRQHLSQAYAGEESWALFPVLFSLPFPGVGGCVLSGPILP